MSKTNAVNIVLSKLSWWFYLALLGIITASYRLMQWNQLPPGLSTTEAMGGIIATKIAHGTLSIGFHPETGYSPLWEILQSASVYCFGSTVSALRIASLIIGIAGMVTTYGWAKSWYTRRIAWVAAFLIAVLPWSVTLSRNGLSTILALFIVTALLWSLTSVMRNPNSKLSLGSLGAAIIIALLAGPWGWLGLGFVLITLLFQRKLLARNVKSISEHKITYGIFGICLLLLLVIAGFIAYHPLSKLVSIFGLAPASQWFVSTLRVATMFFYHGDPDFHHNLGGEPMLNAFIALSFVTGFMVSLSRIQRARDRMLLLLLGLGLIPAIVSGGLVPNAARSALALPAVVVMASIGTFYLLDLWSATFPINSAARSIGQTAIALLLVLTAFQGYTQYFTAWANSGETYVAYNRAATAASLYTLKLTGATQTDFIGQKNELPVAQYLLVKTRVTAMEPEQLNDLPTGAPLRLVISASSHDYVVAILQKRFPGGTLKPHYDVDGSELYYDYQVDK